MIYITKSTNSLDYLRENLEILCGKEGEFAQTDYLPRWIQQTVRNNPPRKGAQACIVFGDHPWELYVPIRKVIFTKDVRQDGDKFIFSFVLGERVEAFDINAFTEQIKATSERQFFVIENKTAQVQPINLPEKESWRKTIQNIVGFKDGKHNINSKRLERYLPSLFLRIDKTFDQDAPIDLVNEKLKIGHQYSIELDCYAPQLSEEKITQMEIVGATEPPIVVVRSSNLVSRDAHSSIKIAPVYGGETRLKIWVQPEQTRSSQIALQCIVDDVASSLPDTQIDLQAKSKSVPGATEQIGIDHVQIQPLYHQLLELFSKQRNSKPDYKRELAHELERLPLNKDDYRFLKEVQGISAWEQGKFDDAYQLLYTIGIEKIRSQEAVAAYFISAWKTNKAPDIRQLEKRFKPSENPDLAAQIQAILPWGSLISEQDLMESFFITGLFKAEVFSKIFKEEHNGENIIRWVRYVLENLGIFEKEIAYRFMRDWIEQNSSTTLIAIAKVARLTLEYGLEIREDVAYLLDDFGIKILSEKEIDYAQQLYQKALSLNTPQRIRMYEALADLIEDYDSLEWRRLTGELFMEAGRYYLKHPNQSEAYIHLAGEYLTKARKAFGDNKKIDLQKLETEWEGQAKETSTIKKYMAQFDENKHARLREIIQGKKVVFVGGSTGDFEADQMARNLGFASGEHEQVYKEKGKDLGRLIKRISKGEVHYIIDMIAFGRHRNELKNACQNAKVKNQDVHYIMYGLRSFTFSSFLHALFAYHKV